MNLTFETLWISVGSGLVNVAMGKHDLFHSMGQITDSTDGEIDAFVLDSNN